MSVTAEEVRRRIAQSRSELTAEDVRRRIAQGQRAAEPSYAPGAQSFGAPDPGDIRTWGERLRGAVASVSEPWVRTAQGVHQLMGATPEQLAEYETTLRELARQAPEGGGRIAGNIIGEAAQMAIPGSLAYRGMRAATAARPFLGRVAPITAESAAIGAVEGARIPEEGQTRLGQALMAGGANLGIGAGQRAISTIVKPQMFRQSPMLQEEMAELQAAGIKPDIPISMGQPGRSTEGTGVLSKFARWMHRRPLASIPPFQGIIQGQQERALDRWRQSILQKAVPEGAPVPTPGPQSLRPVEDTLESIDNWYKAQYREVLDPYDFDLLSPAAPVGKKITEVLEDIPGEGVRRTVDQKVADLVTNKANEGMISGAEISGLKTALRREAKLAQDGAAKQAYYDLIGAIDEGVETQLKAIDPDIASRYQALRQPYRNFITIDDAAGRAQFGEFSPKQLEAASQRKVRSEKIKGRKAPLRKEAQRAVAVYDVPSNTESNIFQLAALGGVTLGGFGGLAAGDNPMWSLASIPTAGAWLAAGGALVPRGARYMSGSLPYQKSLAELLRKPASEELARLARISGGQYLAE